MRRQQTYQQDLTRVTASHDTVMGTLATTTLLDWYCLVKPKLSRPTTIESGQAERCCPQLTTAMADRDLST
jgi:hypothetical protein